MLLMSSCTTMNSSETKREKPPTVIAINICAIELEGSKEEENKLLTLLIFKLEQGNLQFTQALSYNRSNATSLKVCIPCTGPWSL